MPSRPPTHKPRKPFDASKTIAQARERQAKRYLRTCSAQWRAIRKAQLGQFPLCQDCGQVAREVDHNTNDTSRNLIGIELSSLCKPCHSRRTRARALGLPKPRVRGCDALGYPLDPAHPWNAKRSPATEQTEFVLPGFNTPPRIGVA